MLIERHLRNKFYAQSKMSGFERIVHIITHLIDLLREIIKRTNCFQKCPSTSEEGSCNKRAKE